MKKYFLFKLAILFIGNVFFSQSKIDSALNMMNIDSVHDTIKMEKIYSAIFDILRSYPDFVVILSDLAIDKINSSTQFVNSFRH